MILLVRISVDLNVTKWSGFSVWVDVKETFMTIFFQYNHGWKCTGFRFQSPQITAAVSALMGSTINNQLKSWSSKKNWVAQWNNFVLVRSTVTLCCLSQQSLSNRLMRSPIHKMVDTACDQALINNVAGRASLCPPGYLRRVEEKFVGGLALTFSARPLSVFSPAPANEVAPVPKRL